MDIGGLTYLFGAVFGVPILITRFLFRSPWRTIGMAYAIWFGLLVLFALSVAPSGNGAEGAGWAMLFAFFWSIPVICILVLVIRFTIFLRNRKPRYGRA